MSSRPRRRLPYPAARRLLRAGSPLAHCAALWGRTSCDCAALGEQLHLPIDIRESEVRLLQSHITLNTSIEQAEDDAREARHLWQCALDLMAAYGKRFPGGWDALLHMAWEASDREAAARRNLSSIRAERNALIEAAPCLG